MIEINLIPDVKQELIKAQRIRLKVIAGSMFIGVVSVGVVVALGLYVFTVQAYRSNTADTAIKDSNAEFQAIDDLSKILTIQNQLSKINEINDSKMVDSRIFTLLEKVNPPEPNNVRTTSVSIDSEDELITIDGEASNYSAVEIYRKTIANAKVKYNDGSVALVETEKTDETATTDTSSDLTATENSEVTTEDTSNYQEVYVASNVSTNDTSYGQNTSGNKIVRFTISFNYAQELFSPKSKNISIYISNTGIVTDSFLGIPKSLLDVIKIDQPVEDTEE